MTEGMDPQTMHLNYLRHLCAEESEHFFHHQEHDPRFCYEIFRRAILKRDEKAWDCVYNQYHSLVAGWVERHPLFQALDEDRDYFVNCAFEKLWAALTPEKFSSFPVLKSILRYLQMCVHSVLTDAMRIHQQECIFDVDLEGVDQEDTHQVTPEEKTLRRDTAENMLAKLYGKCVNKQERLIVYGSFVLGLKPAELYENYSGEFQNMQQIYRLKENFLARIRRDLEFMAFLESL
jgi:hypothetical protein